MWKVLPFFHSDLGHVHLLRGCLSMLLETPAIPHVIGTDHLFQVLRLVSLT